MWPTICIAANVIKFCLEEFSSKNENIERAKIDNNARAMNRLRKECEEAKERLSSNNMTHTDIYIDSLISETSLHHIKLTRKKFNELNVDLFKKKHWKSFNWRWMTPTYKKNRLVPSYWLVVQLGGFCIPLTRMKQVSSVHFLGSLQNQHM